jgi:predicted ribosomally synthesized peptide with nif11-like leader
MSLKDLDLLLGARHDDPVLAEQLAQPLPLEELITLAQSRGLTITEDDVFQAQQREQTNASAADLQQQMAPESRRLRHFIPG